MYVFVRLPCIVLSDDIVLVHTNRHGVTPLCMCFVFPYGIVTEDEEMVVEDTSSESSDTEEDEDPPRVYKRLRPMK